MAQNFRLLQTNLLNLSNCVGNTQLEKNQRKQRVAEQQLRLEQTMQLQRLRNPSTGTYTLDLQNHGAPKDFDIVRLRQMQQQNQQQQHTSNHGSNQAVVHERGIIPMTRAKWQEQQFEKHFVNMTDDQRLANALHARRNERAVIGTNFVPDTIDDLPECERVAILKSRQNNNDRLWYEIRNTDIMRDGWRLEKERSGKIFAPPIGVVGPC